MTNLFTVRPDEKLDYETVDAFLKQGFSESIRVEYKRGYPDDLAKQLAAFSNTYGGLVLIGVDADQTTNKPTEWKGIPLTEGIEEQVRNVGLDAVFPPIFPHVWLVPVPKSSGVIVVIRIHEGDGTPHSVAKRTGVYLRTGNASTPYERATVDEITELLTKRRVAKELRELIHARSEERFETVWEEFMPLFQTKLAESKIVQKQSIRPVVPQCATFHFVWCPQYPRTPLGTIPQIKELVERLVSPDRMDFQPAMDDFKEFLRGQTVQDGVVFRDADPYLRVLEVTEHGFVSYRFVSPWDVGRHLERPDDVPSVVLVKFARFLISFMMFLQLVYRDFPFYGSSEFSVSLRGVKGYRAHSDYRCLNKRVDISKQLTIDELVRRQERIFLDVVEQLHYAFGSRVTDSQYYSKMFGEHKRPHEI